MDEHLHSEVEKAKQTSEVDSSGNLQIVDAETDAEIEVFLTNAEITDEEAIERVFAEVEAMPVGNETLLNIMSDEMNTIGANFLFNITGINCAVHTLQLAIQDSMKKLKKNHKNVILLCREIGKILRLQSTVIKMETLRIEYKRPRLENKTRWGSMYLMVRNYFNIFNHFCS